MIGGRRALAGRKAVPSSRAGRAAARPISATPAPASCRARGSVRAGTLPGAQSHVFAASSSAGHSRVRPTSKSGCPRRRRWPSSSSDAISSSAYATEEIRWVLVLAGAAAMLLSVQVAIAIAILLAVVADLVPPGVSRVPQRGGSYVVARTNLAPILD